MLDPITTEVIGSLLVSITEEMSAALIRTAYSPNIKERADCSTALFDADGNVLAQAQRLPLHMGSLIGSVEQIVRRFPLDRLQPGDMFLANDPYNGGGSHLPDLNLVAPAFWEDELVGFVANIGHHSDVGGMVPGSESAECRDIFQEGLRLPPLRLCEDGKIREDVLELVQLNSRVPHDRAGDLRAQVAANRVGERGVWELCRRYGVERVRAHAAGLLQATERRARAIFAQIPRGEYVHEEPFDPSADVPPARTTVAGRPAAGRWHLTMDAGSPPIVRVRLQVDAEGLLFDFAGTSPQLPNGRNVPRSALLATVYCVVRSLLDPDIASNSGFYRSIRVDAPAGCLVNPIPPGAVGARALTCGVLADGIVGAVSRAVPARAVAGSGPHQLAIPSGLDPRTGEFFVDYETFAGALGARAYHDGLDAVRIYASGAANLPVEPLEHAFPLRVERYELLTDSGGAGTFRGGLGIRRDYRVLPPEVEVALTGERHHVAARGANGGENGALGRFVLNPGTADERRLPSVARSVVLRQGDLLRIETPGGAGYGPPSDRDPESVRRDVVQGKVSPEAARSTYGRAAEAEQRVGAAPTPFQGGVR